LNASRERCVYLLRSVLSQALAKAEIGEFRSSLKRNSSLLQGEVIPNGWSWERERILVRNRGIQENTRIAVY
jgi:hypothetical protein